MRYRDLFCEIMSYGTYNRMPVIHWATWPETDRRWHQEGLTEGADLHEFLDATPHWRGVGARFGGTDAYLLPPFEEEIYEETETYVIKRMSDGVICKAWKNSCSIPQFLDYTLKTGKDWETYKLRLQPDPARLPENLGQVIADAENSGMPLTFGTGSIMGWIRNWMGVENMSFLMYDEPDVYADMTMTIADLVCWGMDLILPHIQVDLGFGWEDICGRSGPLVSPQLFDKYVAPAYAKIRDKLESYGVHLYGVDCDGDVRSLVGPWLEAGVNLQMPVEVGTWEGDAMELRKRHGRELRIVGNFNKLTLERGREAIEAEIQRCIPMMREGGYIIATDHAVTPGVPLADYQWYLDRIRELSI